MKKTVLALTLLTVLFCGFARAGGAEHFVRVNARSKAFNPGQSYILLPMDENISPNTPEFQSIGNRVRAMLKSRGMLETDMARADTAVLLSYGITGPHQASIPVPGEAPPRTHRMEYTGEIRPQTYYTRWVLLKGVSVKNENGQRILGETLWHVNSFSSGEEGALQPLVPVLLEAGSRHLGKETKKGFAIERISADK